MKYIKKFESFSGPVQEKITDFFKSREEIADALLLALKENPEKALNAMIPYYDDFVEMYYGVSGSEIPRDENGKCTLSSSNLRSILEFVPRFAGTIDAPGIFIKDGDGGYRDNTIVDKSKMGLIKKITRNEILNLLSPHEDFSLRKIASTFSFIFNLFDPEKKVGALRRLDDTNVGYDDNVELMDRERLLGVLGNAETREEEAARKATQAR